MPKITRNPELMQLKRSGVIPVGSSLHKYDGRKRLTAGQKSAVSKLYNIYSAMEPGLDFVHVRRKPKESNNKYKQRVNRIKQNSGQKHPFNGVAVESKFLDFHDNKISFKDDRLNITSVDFDGSKVYRLSFDIDYHVYISEGLTYLKRFVKELEKKQPYHQLKPLNAMGFTTFLSGNLFRGDNDPNKIGDKDIQRMLSQIIGIANAYRQDIDLETSEGKKALNSYNHWFTAFQTKTIEINK